MKLICGNSVKLICLCSLLKSYRYLPTTYEVIWNFIFKQYNIYFLASISVLYYLKIL